VFHIIIFLSPALSMTKQDATIVLRFHAPDSTEGGGSSICYSAGASVRMQKLCKPGNFFVMDNHADAG
jgi:hypothetical protein